MTLDAGDFDEWADRMVAALDGDGDADVPCGECTACCTASQFVHIGPDETDALDHIPGALLFPVPGRPRGHVLMGYDERGGCPMFVDGGCSIYAHRPRTCRTYDCRIFPATGVTVDDDPAKAAIAGRAADWQFAFADEPARVRRQAMRAAAAFVAERSAELFDGGGGSPPQVQKAVLAVELHQLFVGGTSADGNHAVARPDIEAVRVELVRRRARPDQVGAATPALAAHVGRARNGT